MGEMIEVSHLQGDKFEISVRNHTFRVDQPITDGGEDTAPTPTELFVSSLAACVAFYARRYLARHDLPSAGLTVEANYEFGDKPARVADIHVVVHPPQGVPAERLPGLLAVASHCTVHNTLKQAPSISIDLQAPVTLRVA
jgi:uncharacterized OsmC-like protein